MARNYIVIDTEGVDTVTREQNDGVHAETSLFYDLGFAVVSGADGSIIEEYSFINSDVFFNNELMTSAYYANKLPKYRLGMGTKWQVANTKTIMDIFADACKRHNVKHVWAYNSRYDKDITQNTVSVMSNGFKSFFTPYGTEWRDIWDYAGSTICNTRKYVKWCIDNGYMSAKGNPSTSAETVYRYITKDNSFKESHTALEDVHIELQILQAAKKRKQKARKTRGHGWRDASKIAKSM